MTSSLLAGIEMAPRDPILGISEAFAADPKPDKVNLGVGIYTDDGGKVPVLECVRRAELKLGEAPLPRSYLPIDGLPTYDRAVRELLFGKDHRAVREERVVTVQTLGGTGGLKVGADFLRRISPGTRVWVSHPTWENHPALFEFAGFTVNTYPYYEAATHDINFDAMVNALGKLSAGSIIVLHACCHNPTGVDLSDAQWQSVIEIVNQRGLIPFLDIAYQGFAENLETDAVVVRRFAEICPVVLVSSSFSKSLSLYGERVGAFSLVASDAGEATRALSQIKRVIRTNYSNPPTHGGQTVATVLTTPELRALWEQELRQMRDRIKLMRHQLVEKIHALRPDINLDFVIRQRGMFSYSGLTKAQVDKLRTEHAVYAVDSGRICVAALNSKNIDYASRAIASVFS
jgi:aromatic-amino-acid transaminase